MSEIDWAKVEQQLQAKANEIGTEQVFDGVVHRPQDPTAGRVLFALAAAIRYGLGKELNPDD